MYLNVKYIVVSFCPLLSTTYIIVKQIDRLEKPVQIDAKYHVFLNTFIKPQVDLSLLSKQKKYEEKRNVNTSVALCDLFYFFSFSFLLD